MMETACYFDTWKRFVTEGILDASRLNKRIMESWYRCRRHDVNPNLHKGTHVLSEDEFTAQKEKSSLLLSAAVPHLQTMKSFVEEADMMALLVDPDGYVLSLTGNKHVVQDARHINFTEGVRWTEEEVGTNAIGTALQIGEAVMIRGTEHYSVASHSWSCSAAPIRNDDGTMLGVLDISCPLSRTHPLMLGMAASIAHTIERELRVRARQNELELVRKSVPMIETNASIILCNSKKKVVAASKSVRCTVQQYEGMDVCELLRHGFIILKEEVVYSDVHAEQIGTCMHLASITQSRAVPSALVQPLRFDGEAGTSHAFSRVLQDIQRVAPTDASVYLLGETGAGKEVVAKAIHDNSFRKDGPFIAINCGAIPKELMESELFGYADGAFTGAKRKGYKGKFEQANNGTIFLDEIAEMPLSMQVTLLRVLQERKVTPVGGTTEVPLNIRIITATHRDLSELVKEGLFRQDLYYRLHVYPIYVPPLRERQDDIPHLIAYFCEKNNWRIEWPAELIRKLQHYHWPGNIRELFNVLERLRIMAPDGIWDVPQMKTMVQLFDSHTTTLSAPQTEEDLSYREKIQRDLMVEALQKTKGNVSLAAKMLDIPRSTFYKRLQKFNL